MSNCNMKMVFFAVVITGLTSFAPFSKKPMLHLVKMKGMDFIPKELYVQIGDTVRWVNESDTWHNVIAINKAFKSDNIEKKGDTFEFVFSKSGEYKYYCKPHRMMGMKGTVFVSTQTP